MNSHEGQAAPVLAVDLTVGSKVAGLLDDAVAAVLVIDLTAGTITYANRAAERMAGDVSLPVAIDAWSRSAGLRGAGGEPLEQTAHPLSRLATGAPVAGEPVSVRPGEGDGEDNPDGGLFWVTGFPLAENPAMSSLALVLLLELDQERARVTDVTSGASVGIDEMIAMRERAVLATDLAFTITDPHQPDHPLVWVNDAFLRMSGLRYEDAVGRNCRFLQGPATSSATVREIRRALEEEQSLTTTILNYRANGTPFWNQLSLTPVFDATGRLANYVGVQVDVTARVAVEQERAAAFELERQARADLEAVHAQVTLLAEVTSRLTGTLDVEEAMRRLADTVVPGLADWCMVDLATDAGVLRVAASHGDPALQHTMVPLMDRDKISQGPGSTRREVTQTGVPRLIPTVDDAVLARSTDDPEVRAAFVEAGAGSAIIVPLTARSRVLGALTLVMGHSQRVYSEADMPVAIDLARRAALLVDNVRLYEQEHRAAELLQRSLLPVLPQIAGLEAAARYLPSQTGSRVGGDWYDVLALPDGATGIVIGDVMGHDLAAAASMGQLRGILRGYAWKGWTPAEVLTSLDSAMQGLQVTTLATAVYARLERASASAGPSTLTYAIAGHPTPLVRTPDGTVTSLPEVRGPLLGALDSATREDSAIDLPPGSVLALFTDGLVERRGHDLDHGTEQLRVALGEHGGGDDLARVCDAIVDELGVDAFSDDVVLLLLRVL